MSGAVTLTAVRGAMPAAAVLCLGRRLACLVTESISMSPEQIMIDGAGGVLLLPGPPAARWRAPEVRAANPLQWSAPAELWSLGRLLLELALGRAVSDVIADHARDDRLRTLVDVDGGLLPARLIEVLMVLLAPAPGDRLQSPLAAARVFADAEHRFGDGEQALAQVLARSLDDDDDDPRVTPFDWSVEDTLDETIGVVVNSSRRNAPPPKKITTPPAATTTKGPSARRARQPTARFVLWTIGMGVVTFGAVAFYLISPLLK
ncbi:MAG: hypothetical protein Q8O67_30255 [Deltaproteobacteria bacterium]|nr:hypothetical protein [Deltaproteobacteria bacterium]